MKISLTVVIALAFSFIVSIPCAAQVVTTFDIDLEGWMITGDNDYIWQAAGGNPDGNLDVNDRATGDHNYAVAPPAYLGDWSACTAADTLAYEVYLVNTSGGSHSTGQYVFRISGPGGSAWALDAEAHYPPQSAWTRLAVSLSPADWTVTAGTWAELLENVTSLRCNAEFVNGGEEVRIDNISLSSTPGYVFIECAYDDFNYTGTGDWTAQGTNGISNPGNYGNGGGCLQVSDRSGVHSYGFAPAAFLGDWSTYDGAGYVTLDLRMAAYSGTNLGAPEFIRISGPGGTAHVSLDPGEIPTGHYTWETFAFQIDESVWTVDSGTWADILAEVTECRIELEYYDGTETVCLDNFGRMMNDCPPIDEPVVVYDPAVTICDRHSLVKVYNAAYNPMDGGLYAIVRDGTGSGGGLYPVTGAGRGIRMQAYDRPAHLIFDEDGDCYISEDYAGEVNRLAWGGATSVWVSGFHSGDDDPFGMTFAPPGFNGPTVSEGDILVSDRGYSGADQIWSFSPDTAETEQLLMPDPGNVDHYDLAAAASDTVYVSDAFDDTNLYLLDTLGTLTAFPLADPIADMYSIVYDTVDRDIYVAGGVDDAVYRVDPSSGAVTPVAGGFAALTQCCLEINAAMRRLWVTDSGNNRIYELCIGGVTEAEGVKPPPAPSAIRVFPNPFNPATRISFTLPAAADISIAILDVSGAVVKRYGERGLDAGRHEIVWDGRGDDDRPLGSGVYFVRIFGGGYDASAKLVLLR